MTKYNPTNCPGPGDEATWPEYTGHPNDPRAPDDDQDFEDLPYGEQIERLTDEFSDRELAAMYLDEVEDLLNHKQAIRWLLEIVDEEPELIDGAVLDRVRALSR